MKLSLNFARMDSAGRHNDRNFDLSKAEQIDEARSVNNRYYTYNGDTEHTFREVEIEYYRTHFAEMLKERNAKFQSRRQNSKIQSFAQFYGKRNTQPEDVLIQIGDISESADPEVLWQIALEYKDWVEKNYGANCKILTMALHMDEATPHIHIRRVWQYEEDGMLRIGQNRALEQMGISSDNVLFGNSRTNNPKIHFTEMERMFLVERCQAHGIDINDEDRVRRPHMNKDLYLEWKKNQDEMGGTRKALAEMERRCAEMERQRDVLMAENDDVKRRLDEQEQEIERRVGAAVKKFEAEMEEALKPLLSEVVKMGKTQPGFEELILQLLQEEDLKKRYAKIAAWHKQYRHVLQKVASRHGDEYIEGVREEERKTEARLKALEREDVQTI